VALPERVSLRTQKYIVLEEWFLKEVKNSGGLDTIKTPTVWLLLFYNEGKSITADCDLRDGELGEWHGPVLCSGSGSANTFLALTCKLRGGNHPLIVCLSLPKGCCCWGKDGG